MMEISFIDWIHRRPTPEQIADVLAQLLNCFRENNEIMNPNCFSLEFPDEDNSSQFANLIIKEKAENVSPDSLPFKAVNDESHDIGLLLYQMLGYEPQEGVSPLNGKESLFNPLLQGLTDRNVNARISREEALDWLAEKFPSSAIVHMVERETMVEWDSISIPLHTGDTTWKPPSSLQYGESEFFPETSEEYHFPFRLKPMELICYIHANREPVSDIVDIICQSGKSCFGLDFGAYQTNISRLDNSGVFMEISKVPSVIAYQNQQICVYEEEALQLHEQKNADLIHCFDSLEESENLFSVVAGDGTVIQETRYSAMLKFMKYLCRILENDFHYQKDTSCIVVTIPSSSTIKFRDTVQRCAEEAGLSVNILSSAVANAVFQWTYEPFQGNVLVIDAGDSVTDICLIHSDAQNHIPDYAKKWHIGKSARGGHAMTEIIYQNILQTLSAQYTLNMYQLQKSGLNSVQFAENVNRIWKEAQSIKHSLTFHEKVIKSFELYADATGKKTFEIGFTRMQYENLLFPITQEIQNTIHQVLSIENIAISEVKAVLLTGTVSLTPAIRKTIQDVFQLNHCNIKYLDYTMSVVRGAVLFAGMLANGVQSVVKLTEFPEDLGIITADAIYHSPMFQTLISAGTKLENDAVICEYPLFVNAEDLDEEKHCILRLYVRPKGMEHVRSTLDPDGENIRCIGIIKISLPEKYIMKSDKLECAIKIDTHENVTVQVSHYRRIKSNSIMKIIKRVTSHDGNEWKLLGKDISAEYLPLSYSHPT